MDNSHKGDFLVGVEIKQNAIYPLWLCQFNYEQESLHSCHSASWHPITSQCTDVQVSVLMWQTNLHPILWSQTHNLNWSEANW